MRYANQTSSDDWAPFPAICYVIGAVLGDGHVCKQPKSGRYYVRLVVKDKSFAERFADALGQLGIKPHVCFYESCGMWAVVVYSKPFVGYLKRLDLNAVEAMCSTLDLVSAFIAGFYESEGYISIIKRSDRKGSWKPILSIGNTNLDLLRLAQRLLSSIGLTFHIYKQYDAKQMLISGRLVKRKTLYALTTQSALTAGRFFKIIRPCIKLPKIEIPNVNQRIAERSIVGGISDELILKIKKLMAQGLSYKKIGSECGVSPSTVWRQDRQ
jgi:intein-encoded DNA endonuclease-like protein